MKNSIAFLLASLIPYFSFSQECFNAGLEDGTLSGYATYHGRISANGTVTIETPGPSAQQHRIMHISEGFDPIAEAHCVTNKLLPVVPESAGQYTLRLGNSLTGGKAERVILSFTVTPELTFFLLRYAVVLNDPNHASFEQPRFELRILDESGNVFPCGEYQVRSAENIPGFESCTNGWRVRPWTTVGFELQSFLGQKVQIEILTTDCAQGGHAGYAYLDATCQPLEIKLEGYCPGNTDATMSVTDGFINYQWNTGETTNAINIQNPISGTPYQVTVTSATGCTLVLKNTIPNLEELPSPEFFSQPDRSFCRDTALWFHPKGNHLNEVSSPTLGLVADSFLLTPSTTTTYTFVSSDLYGCASDTLQFDIEIAPPAITNVIDSLACFGDSDARIQLEVKSDFLPVRYKWETGEMTSTLSELSAGSYTISVIDNINCTNNATYVLSEPAPLALDLLEMNPITCYGLSDGILEVISHGGVSPYTFQMNSKPFLTPIIDNLTAGTYSIMLRDANNCHITQTTEILEPLPLIIETVAKGVSCYGHSDGEITLTINGGMPDYYISWNDARYNGETSMTEMAAGTYIATITDDLGCESIEQVTVFEPPFNKDCGTYIPNIFSPNGDGVNDVFTVAGSMRGLSLEKLEIYNRWGELVFKKGENCTNISRMDCGWSGWIGNKPAPVGVYIYLIAIRFPEMPEPVIFTGDVQLLK